jgi:hypothetical protein
MVEQQLKQKKVEVYQKLQEKVKARELSRKLASKVSQQGISTSRVLSELQIFTQM